MVQTIRAQQKENTRKTLIETAFTVFSNQGIASTTTKELAKLAKVSHGTIFLHFSTRENLLIEVINEFGVKLSAKFSEAAKGSNDTKAILKAHLQVLEECESFYTRLIEELPSLPDQIRSRFFILQSSISHHIYIHMQQEIEQGLLKNIERSKLFNTWIALIHYYLINREIFCPGRSVISSMGEELINHFLNLIKI
ncbi:MAG: TetR/AcrR family transcriptional regulator [Tatlockia sp.]|nr:TetR/AcrR family transcriptional regulator [Tatlockia sp.]